MIRVQAPAKVNLSLEITGRRPDGYHLVQGITVFAAVADTLSLSPSTQAALSISGPFGAELAKACPVEKNLITIAVDLFRSHSGWRQPVAIALDKNLPSSAGIGGGSADAAATLLGLNALAGQPLDAETLARIGLELGADIPVCLASSTSWVHGVGENIQPLPAFPRFGLVLINCGQGLSTPAVFQQAQRRSDPISPPSGLTTKAEALAFLRGHGNDLCAAACSFAPEIEVALTALRQNDNCLYANMSGSGATCFGLYRNLSIAAAARRDLQRRFPSYWIEAGETLEHREDMATENQEG